MAGIQVLILLIFIAPWARLSGQYYGMQFSSHEFILDHRSGLDLTPDHSLRIKGDLDLQFHLRSAPGQPDYFGYIFRLLVDDYNIDLIQGPIAENPNNFELIIGDKTSKIAFQVPEEALRTEWMKFRFILDFKEQRVSCHIYDTILTDELNGFDDAEKFRLMFGAHSFGNFTSTDVPAMILRDVEVKSKNKLSYTWPLNETEGRIAHSIPEGNDGIAFNPEWLLKKHNTWNQLWDRVFTGTIQTTFDSRNEDLYMVSGDSIHIYNIISNSLESVKFQSFSDSDNTWSIIFDTSSNRLLKYSLDNNYVSVFDFDSRSWSPHAQGTEEQNGFWQHNRAIRPDGTLVAIGGYGFHMYNNLLLAWNPENDRFDSIDYKGVFHPRYLAGSGYNSNDSLFYLIGGYGSESGKQSESPDYYYDVISYSIEERTFRKVFELSHEEAENGFCFANSIVFDDSNNLYGLSFNKYQFDNKLQLMKVSLDKQEIIELGDPIDYNFLDVQSFADLHFSKSSNSLLALSRYSAAGTIQLAIHSIAFPPQVFTREESNSEESYPRWALYIIIGIALIVSAYLLYKSMRGRKMVKNIAIEKPRLNISRSKENSIILFGGFQVIDRNGKDITGQFTPLPKRLFLFILLHSLRNNKGVSSNTLYETFWFDKSVESARNNRAVNIVKLKSLLENLETTSISKDTGYWKFDFDPSKVRIDFFEYLQIVSNPELTRENIVDLMSITDNKPFLYNISEEWLDQFKSEVSNDLIDAFLKYINTSKDDPEFLLDITNCVFLFDSVSEEALKIQCRLMIQQGKHSLAKKAYSKFLDDYRHLYDEEYGLSFNQVIEEK
ncbi:MAG: hypothetical protein GY790_12615 [Bacteroidetes bacterium]|nr:hypothetical protein [Bacteroidota bacterium]